MKSNLNIYDQEILNSLIAPSLQNEGFNTFDFLRTMQEGSVTINQRESLINIIANLCNSVSASTKVEQLAVYYLDALLSKKKVIPKELEILAIAVFSMALKYEESRLIHPDSILAFSEGNYNKELIQNIEIYIMINLDWKLEKITPDEILKFLINFTCDNFNSERFFKEASIYTRIALTDYELSMNSPLFIAISSALCVFITRRYDDFYRRWIQILERHTGFDLSICSSIARRILSSQGISVQ